MSVELPCKVVNRVTTERRCESILCETAKSAYTETFPSDHGDTMTDTGESVRARILVSGRVQGVGYRAFTCRMAIARGLAGCVENLDSGQVAVDVQGGRPVLEAFLAELNKGPVGARVTQVQVEWGKATGRYHDFTIR